MYPAASGRAFHLGGASKPLMAFALIFPQPPWLWLDLARFFGGKLRVDLGRKHGLAYQFAKDRDGVTERRARSGSVPQADDKWVANAKSS
jgi:hypothetical protein